MERAAANAKYARLHEALPYHDGTQKRWAKERSDSHPYRFDEGVTIWVHDEGLSPDDDFLSGSAVEATEVD